MKQYKKLVAILLSFALTFSLYVPAAGESYNVQHGDAAEALWNDGLFLGSGDTFDLDKPLTRAAGITMIVRLLGKEKDAIAKSYKTPFNDVPNWAKPYVGYCYENNVSFGTGATTFGSNDSMTAAQYITLVLRILKYDDKAGDFSWDKAAAKALEIGIIDKSSYTQYTSTNLFLRDHAAFIAYNALSLKLKGTDSTLKSIITLPGKPEGKMPVYTLADVVKAPEPTKPTTGSVNWNSCMNINIALTNESNTTMPDSCPGKARNFSDFIGDGYASTRTWAVRTDGSVFNPENTIYATSGSVKLYSYWMISSPATVELAIICDNKTIHTIKNFTFKNNDYVDIILTVDMAALSAKLGKGDHTVSIATINPVYSNGKLLYNDTSVKQTFHLCNSVPGSTFKLSKGIDGSNITNNYLYAGGKPYGVKYFFTLETGSYSGTYTMSFPAEDGTDVQKFTVEANSIYHITYTYNIKYIVATKYKYKFDVKLTGPKSASLSFDNEHPGKMNIGKLNIIKKN